MNTLRGIRAVK